MSNEPSYRDAVPGWMTPVAGFTADEFLALRDLPRHTELIDGGLVLVAPQRNFHMAAIDFLTQELRRQCPAGLNCRILSNGIATPSRTSTPAPRSSTTDVSPRATIHR